MTFLFLWIPISLVLAYQIPWRVHCISRPFEFQMIALTALSTVSYLYHIYRAVRSYPHSRWAMLQLIAEPCTIVLPGARQQFLAMYLSHNLHDLSVLPFCLINAQKSTVVRLSRTHVTHVLGVYSLRYIQRLVLAWVPIQSAVNLGSIQSQHLKRDDVRELLPRWDPIS